MGIILVVLVLAVIFAGLGFAIHGLWVLAAVLFVLWLVTLMSRRQSKSQA
jgi:hypothetical protein